MTTKRILFAVLCVLLALVIIMFAVVLSRFVSLLRPQASNPGGAKPTSAPTAPDTSPTGTQPPHPTDHEHNYEFLGKIDATCTGYGWNEYKCTICGHTEMLDRVEPLEHIFSAGEVVTATCTEEGYSTYKCSRCGEIEHRDVAAALGHEYGEATEVAATCGEDAYTAYHCTREDCEEVKKENVQEGTATGEHVFGQWAPNEDGTQLVRTCEVCHLEETKPNDSTPPVEEMKIISQTPEDLLDGETPYRRYTIVIGTDSNPSAATYVVDDYLNNGTIAFAYDAQEGLVVTFTDASGASQRYVLADTNVTIDQSGNLVG